jgi:hypothetical protein
VQLLIDIHGSYTIIDSSSHKIIIHICCLKHLDKNISIRFNVVRAAFMMYHERISEEEGNISGTLTIDGAHSKKFALSGTYEYYSDGSTVLTFNIIEDTYVKSFLSTPLDLKTSIRFDGKTNHDDFFRAYGLVIIHQKSEWNKINVRLKAKNCIVTNKNVDSKICQIEYILDNFELSSLIGDFTFKTGRAEFKLGPIKGYNENLEKLKKLSGVLPTCVLLVKPNGLTEKYIDRLVDRVLYIISFAKSTYISCSYKTVFYENKTFRRELQSIKKMPFDGEHSVLDFRGDKVKSIVEPGLKLWSELKTKYGLIGVIELYIEALAPMNLDAKIAIQCIAFERLKSCYREYCKKNGQYKKVQLYNKKKNVWVDKSFKNILLVLFKDAGFRFRKSDLKFIDIRNAVIHEGQLKSFKRQWEIFYKQRALLVRFILTVVGYKGGYDINLGGGVAVGQNSSIPSIQKMKTHRLCSLLDFTSIFNSWNEFFILSTLDSHVNVPCIYCFFRNI